MKLDVQTSGIGVMGTGIASAATQPPVVISDQIKYTGRAMPTPIPGTYRFTSTTCTLTSDPVAAATTATVEGPFPCWKFGQLKLSATGATGSAMVASADGIVVWSFTLTRPAPGSNVWAMFGTGTEYDSPTAGEPADAAYRVTVSGSMTLTPTPVGGYLIAGNATVAELVGSP